MPKVEVELQVSPHIDGRGDVPPDDEVADLVTFVVGHEGAAGDWTVVIRMTSDEEIRRMHRYFMGIDTPTDIMTFPYEALDVSGVQAMEQVAGGDLVISMDHIRENAVTAGWSARDELLFVIVHGVLHLLGWDDQTGGDRDAMLARQHELLGLWART